MEWTGCLRIVQQQLNVAHLIGKINFGMLSRRYLTNCIRALNQEKKQNGRLRKIVSPTTGKNYKRNLTQFMRAKCGKQVKRFVHCDLKTKSESFQKTRNTQRVRNSNQTFRYSDFPMF